MAHVLLMPRQGNTVESCIIQEWKVREGDQVQADTAAAMVETDKAAFEIPAGADGQVLKLLFAAGDDVPVLTPIAVIGTAGEDWKAAAGSGQTAGLEQRELEQPAMVLQPETGLRQPSAGVPAEAGSGQSASPRAKRRAIHENFPLEGLHGSGPGGRILERDVEAAIAGRPLLTTAAAASGPVPPGTEGTGLGGRIRAADLVPSARAPDKPDEAGEEGNVSETPVKGIRKLIAARMRASLAESAQFTLNASASAVRLKELRARMKAAGERDPGLGRITLNDMVMFAVSRILPAYPYMNARLQGETLSVYERVHLGMAVDTPRGLMVPVIRNASLLSLRQLSAEAARLAGACRDGSAKPGELSGSTFTVSNLGAFGVTGFTPVLNAPEAAILGVCGVELKPVEQADGSAAFEPCIGLSLTIDHQVIDGAPAARFLAALCKAVSDIDLLLAGI